MKNYYSVEIQNTLKSLQKYYNILVIFHSSEPENKKIFITSNFTPAQNLIYAHIVIGQDITNLLETSMTQNVDISQINLTTFNLQQKQTFNSQIDEIPIRTYEFCSSFDWIWWKIN